MKLEGTTKENRKYWAHQAFFEGDKITVAIPMADQNGDRVDNYTKATFVSMDSSGLTFLDGSGRPYHTTQRYMITMVEEINTDDEDKD
jgi:hypothetical protein